MRLSEAEIRMIEAMPQVERVELQPADDGAVTRLATLLAEGVTGCEPAATGE